MFLTAPEKTESEKLSERMMGNKFYLLRSKDGRDKIFKTPEDLWEKCCEYFEWVEKNPLKEERVFLTKTGVRKVDVTKTRAMTLKGLYVKLGIVEGTFLNYRKIPEYKWVTDTVDNIMYAQKFEGAAAGMLSPTIIARDLGLVDKKDVTANVATTKKNFNDFYNTNEKE